MVLIDYTIRIALDEKLKELQITRYELSRRTGIKYQTIDNYYKNKVQRYDNDLILKMCVALGCSPGDIIKVIEIPDS